jgi:glycosyltransferase involved in cell wall biosynthesis
MTGEEYAKLISENKVVDLVRPYWIGGDYHKKIWADNNITVLICQRKTRDEIKLCLESLLTFYPDINVLVVDGNSEDESTMYLHVKSALYPNVKIWERNAINSHGITMDEAIRQYITTDYVLLMDSDVITTRCGYIEGMLDQFKQDPKLYATGNLMLVTRQNEGCGVPYDETDILRYAHPCCSIYHAPTYKNLKPFENHGAPCAINLIHAEKEGYNIGYYPVDMYTIHLSGASWCIPKTVWVHDQGVKIRPLVTFILEDFSDYNSVMAQQIVDFDIIPYGKLINAHLTTHDAPAKMVNNFFYDIRFNVSGEYVCEPQGIDMKTDFIFQLQNEIIKEVKDEYVIDGVKVIKRNIWQHNDVFE